jgi:polysaccharide export outer membrane protein
MTVLEALSEAGLDDFAKRTKIYVLRGKTRLPFNYKDVIQGKHPEQNVVLQAGDTVVVP